MRRDDQIEADHTHTRDDGAANVRVADILGPSEVRSTPAQIVVDQHCVEEVEA